MDRLNDDPAGRLLNTKLGGGSLLDIGIYPIFWPTSLGMPEEIIAKAHFNAQGTEIQTSIVFHYHQAQAQLYSSLTHPIKMEAKLFGLKVKLPFTQHGTKQKGRFGLTEQRQKKHTPKQAWVMCMK